MEEPNSEAPAKVRFGLGLRLSIGLTLIIGIIFAGVSAFNLVNQRQSRRDDATSSGKTVAFLVAGAILDELGQGTPIDSPRVAQLVRTFLTFGLIQNKANKTLAFAALVDPEGKLITGRAKTSLVRLKDGSRTKDEQKILEEVAKHQGKLRGHIKPIRFPLVVSGQTVGRLIVGTSLEQVERDIQRELLISVAVLLLALVVLVVYASLTLRGMVVKPLKTIAGAMHEVQTGNLEEELDIKRSDEIGQLVGSYNYMVQGLREQARLKDAFNKYVSEKVYEKFREGAISLEGETKTATILFSDIRSFTSLSEKLQPHEVVSMLNEYFSAMVDIVFKHDGMVNKFMGDAIMALYNVPVEQDHPELRAVRTALEMVSALKDLNARREARGEYPIRVGIGVNTGPVTAGNLGHIDRLEYTVIGDAVNLAQRIESQTKVAGAAVLISETTYAAVAHEVTVEALPPVKVKGKAKPVALYAVTGFAGQAPIAPLITPG